MISGPENQVDLPSLDEAVPTPQQSSITKSFKEPISPSFNYDFSKDFPPQGPGHNISEAMGSVTQDKPNHDEKDEFIRKLMTKIRKQADMLSQMEQYKIMYEMAIQDRANKTMTNQSSELGNSNDSRHYS
jgi:hypothetical protein